ncbi:hypothetical protein DWW10_15180 [Bacteroides intestinalis]|uniref:Uncharacterized protein n=1 Tax=Bacteroides intestinalis TaxID=329854 RepID=A0A412Y3L3_9BACE|nr:hypothetical protein [Bacteroides intestinalis]RGV52015.1 hypothetical protein DWW10_15180 [Bacteroides intestinalis]RHA57900.1 hypothetical protein DW932_16545 [Bacteroides intestinalis]
MLTQLTQTAIAVLYDIYTGGYPYRTTQYPVAPHCLTELLTRLETGGLIRRKDASADNLLSSYELARPYSSISLLDVLEVLDEHLNCNHPTREEMYAQYRLAANRLGIINHMTRLYLSEIKLFDL